MSWCIEYKNHHIGNYSRRTRVQCYRYNEIGHYAHDGPEKVLMEPRVLESGALNSMRGCRPPNPNKVGGVQNKVSANIGPF